MNIFTAKLDYIIVVTSDNHHLYFHYTPYLVGINALYSFLAFALTLGWITFKQIYLRIFKQIVCKTEHK